MAQQIIGREWRGPDCELNEPRRRVKLHRWAGKARPEQDAIMTVYSETIFNLVEYEVWCNLQAVDFLSRLSGEECRRDFGFGLRTPHRTMSHIADVMRGWSGCVGPTIELPSWPSYDERETLGALRKRIADTGESWLAATKDSDEQGVLGSERRLSHVFHLVTHGTHHRGQLLSMLTLMGYQQPFEGGDYGGWSDTTAQPRQVGVGREAR